MKPKRYCSQFVAVQCSSTREKLPIKLVNGTLGFTVENVSGFVIWKVLLRRTRVYTCEIMHRIQRRHTVK